MRYLALAVLLVFARVCSAASPVISSISPTSGPAAGGTVVVITGTAFTGATAVNFGVTPAPTFTVVSDTSITATSPAGTSPVEVTVTTASGTNATGPADLFTYESAPVTLQSFEVD